MFNLIQISYASSSSVLTDRSVYPTLFRTVPSDEVLAPALVTLMNYFGWRKLAILTEKEPQFEKVLTSMVTFMYSSFSACTNWFTYSLLRVASTTHQQFLDSCPHLLQQCNCVQANVNVAKWNFGQYNGTTGIVMDRKGTTENRNKCINK